MQRTPKIAVLFGPMACNSGSVTFDGRAQVMWGPKTYTSDGFVP